MTQETESPRQTMMRLSTGFLLERALFAVTKLNVADHLRNEAKTAKEIAKLVDVDPGVLHRLMRAVAGMGVFHQDANNAFSLTPLGQFLRTDNDESVRNRLLFFHEFMYPSMSRIMDSLKSGRSGFEEEFGMPFFEYTKQNLDLAELFNTMIKEQSRSVIPAIMEAYDFSDCGCVVDVGGGTGTFLSSILTGYDGVSGVLFDVPSAVEAAKEGAGGPLPRCEIVTGDFFGDDLPRGDTYVLKSILHIWDDEKATTILRNCRKASEPGARFIIVERLIGPPNELGLTHYYDLTMMVQYMTQDRSEDEYRAWLKQADIKLERSIPTKSPFHILEAYAE